MKLNWVDVIPVAVSFGLALALTFAVRSLARRYGIVARPKNDRWHRQPTALMGGVAIFLSVLAVYLIWVPQTTQNMLVMGANGFLFVVGLVDDFYHIKPYQKLIGQIMGSALVIMSGLSLPWTESVPVNDAITIFWLVGITNALNLLDNMDGLAGGVAVIAAFFLALCFLNNGQDAEAIFLAVFAAAVLGFLVYNSNPASIFMGDCGSMFVGFFLASAALHSASPGRSRSLFAVLAVPVLILFIPIFDTTFVTILRKLAGRPASCGGRDHTSHRLVALGLSERRAVWMLYAFAAISGLVAILVREFDLIIGLPAIIAFVVTLSLLGVHLARVKVYEEKEVEAARERPLVAFLVDISYKRRLFEVLLDVLLIVLAYQLAYVLLFGHEESGNAWPLFTWVIPVLVFVKMMAFLTLGVYRGLWRYVSIDNLVDYTKAVGLGSVVSAGIVLLAQGTANFPASLFIVDAVLLLFLLAGSRIAFRLLRGLLPIGPAATARRVLIYGAGDGGELFLRELRNNADWQVNPVGFVDDDPLKKGKVIHGLHVLGGNGALLRICVQQEVEEVVISSHKIPADRIKEIARDCGAAGIALRRMSIQIEPIKQDDE